jgi:hypothetical protein
MYVLTPGKLSNVPSGQPGDVFVFKQASYNSVGGIYYLDGGGFKASGSSLIMDSATTGGVMLYNAPNSTSSSQGINISGTDNTTTPPGVGVVNLSGLTSGPYAGIVLWQARTATQSLNISAQSQFSISGTFYAANADLQITGQSGVTVGSQYISRTLNLSGGGSLTINYTDDLTARKREVRLVE